jgi:hypothetical protein
MEASKQAEPISLFRTPILNCAQHVLRFSRKEKYLKSTQKSTQKSMEHAQYEV